MLYRIFTERKRVRRIRRICDRLFPAYTMYRASGVWRGVAERSLVIEVLSQDPRHTDERVIQAAKWIREFNGQECVLVEVVQCESVFVGIGTIRQ